ncbi:hypothetical protein KP509_34G006700 [Ceratopteris richardii]|uniref:Uncharacterized protein n=1 Tax=Ceratopteris richardii TaxID=49495 RepID=A0A8T2QHR1_CERRI|nr:hypothetical protein KP509_34G006700 [Ceratopteris richardii]
MADRDPDYGGRERDREGQNGTSGMSKSGRRGLLGLDGGSSGGGGRGGSTGSRRGGQLIPLLGGRRPVEAAAERPLVRGGCAQTPGLVGGTAVTRPGDPSRGQGRRRRRRRRRPWG